MSEFEGEVIPVEAMRLFAKLLKDVNWAQEDQDWLAQYLENFGQDETSRWADSEKDKHLIDDMQNKYRWIHFAVQIQMPDMLQRLYALQTDAQKEAYKGPPQLPSCLRPKPGEEASPCKNLVLASIDLSFLADVCRA